MRGGGSVFSQLYMAQILKYKQGLTTCVTLTTYSTILCVIYKPQSRECHAVSMCSAVTVAEIFTYVITCVLACVCVLMYLHMCVSGGPENKCVGVLLVCVLCFFRCSGVVASREAVSVHVCVCVCLQWLPCFPGS